MENSISALFILLVAFILFVLMINKTNDYYGGGRKSTQLTSGLPVNNPQTPLGANPPPNYVTGRVGGYEDMPTPSLPYDITNDII